MTAGHHNIACLACGSSRLQFWAKAKDVEYHSVENEFSYYRCLDCHALSIDPVPDDRLAEIYPPTYYSFVGDTSSVLERIKQSLDRRMFRSLFRDLQKDQLSALDVGGGSGWLLTQAKYVEPRLKKTVVVDIDKTAEEAARAAGHAFFLGRIENFTSSCQFDLVLMLNLIEHVRNPVDVLSKIDDLLAPGGRILIKTPNYDSLDARIFRHHCWGGYHCPRHWVLFTPESFECAVRQAGLRVIKLELTQGAPFWSFSVLYWLAKRSLAEVSYERPMYRHLSMPFLLAFFAAFDFLRRPLMRTSQMFVVLGKDLAG